MNNDSLIYKFGEPFVADTSTYKMGIDRRITKKLAERFENMHVLETCTGGGFTTIALAKSAFKVTTIEINKINQEQAIANLAKVGLSEKVKFILGDCLNDKVLSGISNIDAAFLDPDWADNGKNHIYKFVDSNTRPPADQLLNRIMKITMNIALILPPFISEEEFKVLNNYEFQKIYLEDELSLFVSILEI